MKKCNQCKEVKELTEYSKNKKSKDGYRSTCKECSNIAKKKWYEKKKSITYSRSREWKKNNREKYLESSRKTSSRPEARIKKREVNKKYRDNNPKRVKANDALKYAVRHNKIKKSCICEVCNSKFDKTKICGHHEDYDKPLLVVWLCFDCHTNCHLGDNDRADEIRMKVKEIYKNAYYTTNDYIRILT